MDSERQSVTRRVTLVGALVNCLLASAQILVGLLGRSQALLADGVHTLSDLVTDLVVLYASRRAGREADEDHPYGHGRIETLATLLLGGMLGMVGVGIGIRGVDSMFDPARPEIEAITLLFAGLAIALKEGMYHYTMRAARAVHSSMLKSNAWHHRSDALSSVVVFIGIGGQLLGIPHMDAIAAIVVGMMILLIGFRLVRGALDELIDTGLDADLVASVGATMEDDDNVIGIHNLRTRSMGGLGFVDAHLEVGPELTVSEAHYIAHKIERRVKREFPQIADIQIHIDPVGHRVRESVLTALPERNTVERDLAEAWRAIDSSAAVQQIKLHYLRDRIEIDLILPLAMSEAAQAGAVDALRSAAAGLEYVDAVNIYYT